MESRFETVDRRLLQFLSQTIKRKLEIWKDSLYMNRVSLPKLIDVEWAVHIEKSSSQVSSIELPLALVQLEVENEQNHVDDSIGLANSHKIVFEMNKQSLETMLDGLHKIRDQLSSLG